MEYLQVFDKDRNILNEKVARSEKRNLPEGKCYMIVLIFIENEEGKFLLQKTSAARHSCIATTGGHVTYGDTALKTIVKECKEELGIDIPADEISSVYTAKFENALLEVFYIKKDLDINKLILQEEEVESVNWYTNEEILEFIKNNEFRESNIEPYNKVLEYINRK